MSIIDKDFVASDYARARVEEIKRKVALSKPLSKENFDKYSSKENYVKPPSIQSSNTKTNFTSSHAHSTTAPLRETYNAQQISQYQNRIKNIESINQKIKNMLGNGSSIPIKKDYLLNNRQNKAQQSSSTAYPKLQTNKQNKVYSTYQKRQSIDKKTSLADFEQTISIEYQSQPKYQSYKNPTIQETQKNKYDKYCTQKYSNQKKQRLEVKGKVDSYSVSPSFTKKQDRTSKEEVSGGNKQVTHLAETLGQQVLLDQKFRQAKWVFSEWNNPNKWDILASKYQAKYPGSNIEQPRQVFHIGSEEHNPFFQTPNQITQKCVQTLLITYKQALDYWQVKVDECARIDRLEKQFFNIKDIDLNKKGYISVEDLVCFVNLYTGNFFRNRDVISLYKRFTKSDKLAFERFLDKVTK